MYNGARICWACNKVISIGSTMMWIEDLCYHDSCARSKIEMENKIYSAVYETPSNKCIVCDCEIKVTDLVYFDANGKRKHSECPSLNDREKELYFKPNLDDAPFEISFDSDSKIEFLDPKPKRKSWKQYFIDLTDLVSTRSTCSRKHVGSVIVRNNRIVSTGYNGSGETEKDHCDDVGHFMVDDHCTRTVHAERNALKFCIDNKIDLQGCSIFINVYPCWQCFGEIIKSGIREIYYKDSYRNDELIEKVAKFLDIKIEKV